MPASPFHVDHLPNGLTLLGQHVPEVQSAAVCFAVNTGARDDHPPLKGVSHFLEHMVLRGRAGGRPGEEITRAFEEMGAENTPFPGHDFPVYYGRVLSERLPAC